MRSALREQSICLGLNDAIAFARLLLQTRPVEHSDLAFLCGVSRPSACRPSASVVTCATVTPSMFAIKFLGHRQLVARQSIEA